MWGLGEQLGLSFGLESELGVVRVSGLGFKVQ